MNLCVCQSLAPCCRSLLDTEAKQLQESTYLARSSLSLTFADEEDIGSRICRVCQPLDRRVNETPHNLP
jgi:hypothetical protein